MKPQTHTQPGRKTFMKTQTLALTLLLFGCHKPEPAVTKIIIEGDSLATNASSENPPWGNSWTPMVTNDWTAAFTNLAQLNKFLKLHGATITNGIISMKAPKGDHVINVWKPSSTPTNYLLMLHQNENFFNPFDVGMFDTNPTH